MEQPMRYLSRSLLASVLCLGATPLLAQERAAPKKVLTFAEALDLAKKSAEAEKYGAAISALQAAIRELQSKQRLQVLDCLPKPEGWTVQDEEVDKEAAALFGGQGFGAAIVRTYTNGDKQLRVEVMPNTPLVGMLSMMFNNPAILEAQGGEVVKYGAHKAILQKSGDSGHELQLLMHEAHLIKVSADGIDADAMLKIFDQATVDKLEKPLGK
jgi:hypothetical protein